MKRRRINIEVWDENISLKDAVACVLAVIAQGRISDNGNSFCYATTFEKAKVAVESRVNKLDEGSDRISSDSFRVVPIHGELFPPSEEPSPQISIAEVYGTIDV